ncbi:hypothetical protein GALL_548620 [mine drainage metagenome]|uniref:Uncharacterized protein n=1 Tax=mine drainage metagenome TaxID=410659 RepID=A0A1J5NXT8_9ZZZZ
MAGTIDGPRAIRPKAAAAAEGHRMSSLDRTPSTSQATRM